MISTIGDASHNATARASIQLEHIHEQLQRSFDAPQFTHAHSSHVAIPHEALTPLADTLSTHCHTDSIHALLYDVVGSPKLLDEIAARSYYHGNGFLKVVLLDRGYKLRLHIWFKGSACEENIHSHRWAFASHVLTGALKSELWTDAANDDTPTLTANEYRYTAEHTQHKNIVKATKQLIGHTALLKQQDITQHAGTSYVMTQDQLHRINHPGQELVATIICTAPTAVLTNRLFPNTDMPKLHPSKLSANELYHALNNYLELNHRKSIAA